MRLLTVTLVAALALAGCASTEIDPVDAPRHVEADPWDVPTLSTGRNFFTDRSRATSFAGAVRLQEPPYSNEDLRRNFLSIAMRAEAADNTDDTGNIVLAKWQSPIRYGIISGTPTDHTRVGTLTTHLETLTGLDIAPVGRGRPPNIEIQFVAPQERGAAVAGVTGGKPLGPQVSRLVRRWRDTEHEKCLGLMATDPRSGSIINSVILIKDELPRHIRNACIVEEIVQSLGLMNDDRTARPSIFNDDQRYLELTSHDEYLLRILYDPRIRPGMRRSQVAPLSRRIIQELRQPARSRI